MSTNDSNIADTRQITALSLLPLHFSIAGFICTVNIITIIVFVKSPSLRTIPNLYLISLAVADLLTGLYLPSVSLSLLLSRTAGSNGAVLCFLLFAAFIVVSCQSFITITLIAIDRFIYIIYPFHYERLITSFSTKTTIVASWVTSITVAAMAYPTAEWEKICYQITDMSPRYQNGILTFFILLTAIVGVLYTVITKAALRQRNRIQMVTLSQPNSMKRGYFKYVKLFLMVYVLFVLCWLPLFLVFIIRYVTGYHSVVSQRICATLAFLNSGTNFFVYMWKNMDFRKTLKKLCAYKKNEVDVTRSTGTSCIMTERTN